MLLTDDDPPGQVPYSSRPFASDELVRLFNSIPWYHLLAHSGLDGRSLVNDKYGRFLSVNMLKALVLPFLVRIPTEHALARDLEEVGSLQSLCGFVPGDVPSRGTLWNFRRTFQAQYPVIILGVLSMMALEAERDRRDLPYVKAPPNNEESFAVQKSRFYYSPQSICDSEDTNCVRIEIWQTPATQPSPARRVEEAETTSKRRRELGLAKTADEWLRINRKYRLMSMDKDKSWLINDLSLPVLVKTFAGNALNRSFTMDAPDWLEIQPRDRDTATRLRSSAVPYIACNIIVVRELDGKNEVLLALRRTGFGEGTYAMPGGKVRHASGETGQEGAARELKEETGLALVKSRPVAVKITHFRERPWVISIGILAEEYSGEPRNTETVQKMEWGWFDIENLPRPLFEPTRIALEQYRTGRYAALDWRDLEALSKNDSDGQMQLVFGEGISGEETK